MITSTMPAIFMDSANESLVIFQPRVLEHQASRNAPARPSAADYEGVQLPAIRHPITTARMRLIGVRPRTASHLSRAVAFLPGAASSLGDNAGFNFTRAIT